ncbi:MAG: hypothetical protein EBR82_07395 [Caulobacteraceae bacterium]|nr:hypothetical protein [Caulobacteraceae bacterium]
MVCKDKKADAINIRIMEGVGNHAIAEEFGVTVASVAHHRTAGHANRDITRQVLDAQGGPLSEFAQVAIATKLRRVRELDYLYKRVRDEIESQDKGKLDGKMVAQAVNILGQAAKELGQWAPDGGDQAAATKMLAQSIVIHALAKGETIENKVVTQTIDAKSE